MAREGMNRDHQESEARCQQSSTAEGPVAYADVSVICTPSEKNKSMSSKMMKMKNDFSSSSSSSSSLDEEKKVKNLGNPSVLRATNDEASLPSSSLIFGPSQEFLSRRSECLSTSLDISACSSHGITVPSFEMSFCGKPSSENMMMFGPLPQEPDVRADILCSECSADTSGTTSSISGLSYDGDSSSFDDIAHASQEHDACIAPDSFHTMSQGHSITNSSSELKVSSYTVFLPQKPGLGSGIPPPMPGPVRCLCCRKKLGLLGFKCRCGDLFCALHRYSDKHNCRFDYRTAAKEAIAKANPVVKAPKIWKL